MIKTYTLNETEDWEKVVRSFEKYDVYYLPGYVRAFELNKDGQAVLIYFENGSTRAINVVMKRDLSEFPLFADKLSKGEWFDQVTPYGYGGFLIEGEDYFALQSEYEEFAKKERIISEFVRFHPILANYDNECSIYEKRYMSDTVYIDTTDEEIIWKNITSKNRNVIRKAQKSGLEVYWTRDKKIIEPFMNIYNATMDKDHASRYYYFGKDFYESILNDLKYNAMWFYAKKDDQIAAISIFLFENGQMHYHLSASRKELQHLAPTNLLLYEAALWACKNGYKTLHLGGGVGGSSEDSLYKFKKAFNRSENTKFFVGKRIFDEHMYNVLMDFRKEEQFFNENSAFFPLYRNLEAI